MQVFEELHRHQVIEPLYRVDLASSDPGRVQDLSGSLTAQHVSGTVVSELLHTASEGRAADPAAELFRPWPTERRRTLWPTFDSGYVYSRHQLLSLDVAMSFVEALKPKREGERNIASPNSLAFSCRPL